ALRVQRLQPVAAECNALRDQHAGAGDAVIVGEVTARHRDRERRIARQQRETNLRFQLLATLVAYAIVEIARELDEQLAVQPCLWLRVFDREEKLAPGAATVARRDCIDRRDRSAVSEYTAGAKRPREKRRTARAQRFDMRGNAHPQV